MPASLRLVQADEPAPPTPSEADPAGSSWEVWLAFGAALVALILALASPDPGAQALGRLPAVERAAFFRRTQQNVALLCAGEPAFRAACREEAALLRLFPECDGACQAATWARPGPTR